MLVKENELLKNLKTIINISPSTSDEEIIEKSQLINQKIGIEIPKLNKDNRNLVFEFFEQLKKNINKFFEYQLNFWPENFNEYNSLNELIKYAIKGDEKRVSFVCEVCSFIWVDEEEATIDRKVNIVMKAADFWSSSNWDEKSLLVWVWFATFYEFGNGFDSSAQEKIFQYWKKIRLHFPLPETLTNRNVGFFLGFGLPAPDRENIIPSKKHSNHLLVANFKEFFDENICIQWIWSAVNKVPEFLMVTALILVKNETGINEFWF